MLSLVVPSYSGHINEIERLLTTNKKYNKDYNTTTVYIIISYHEYQLFHSVTNKFEHVKIVYLKDLMKHFFDIDIDENEFLIKVGANVFQSFKKLLGMLYCGDEIIFLTDSETYFIRDCNMVDETKNATTVLFSYKTSNHIQESVIEVTKRILNINTNIPWMGLVFSYQWCFRKQDVMRFFCYHKERINSILLMNSVPYFFIEHTLYAYLYKNNIYYNFIDVTDILSYTDVEHFWYRVTNCDQDKMSIEKLLSVHTLFCYSVQNTWNDEPNNHLLNYYKNFKLLTSTPSTFIVD